MFLGTIFGIKGYLQFTQASFLKAQETRFRPNALDKDLTGKQAIVTGANSGLGFQVARALAKRNAKVTMVCRNEAAGKKALESISLESGNQDLCLSLCDLSLPASVKQFAESYAKNNDTCDILVNNAGALLNEYSQTTDGLEKSFAANTLGTYFLTKLMLPTLNKTPGSRIVTVSSGGMYTSKLDPTKLQMGRDTYDGVKAYADHKRAQVELTNYWAEENPAVLVYSMHPGWSDTPGVQTALPQFRQSLGSSLRTSEQGADTIVWAAVSDEVAEIAPTGSFLFDRQVASQHLPYCEWVTKSKPGDVVRLVKELDSLLEH